MACPRYWLSLGWYSGVKIHLILSIDGCLFIYLLNYFLGVVLGGFFFFFSFFKLLFLYSICIKKKSNADITIIKNVLSVCY